MPQYERLCEEGRISRRTMADAIEVLHQKAGFGDNDRAEIAIGLLKLPSAEIVGLVQIIFDPQIGDKAYVVSLPTSKQFKAYRTHARQRAWFDIVELHGALLDGSGTVLLADGTALWAVEVLPTRLPLEPTELDWRIVHCTLSIIGAAHCYRSWGYGLPPQLQRMLADLRILDCGTLGGLILPLLKAVAFDIRQRDPLFADISDQQIANGLRKFGIRIPRSRPRIRTRQAFATI
jgi:hypothetical protein